MTELRQAKMSKIPKPIIPVFVERDFSSWNSQDLVYMCQLRSSSLLAFDFSMTCEDPMWEHEDGPNIEVFMSLNVEVDALASQLRAITSQNI
jgi:hypothetical protein